MTPNRKQERKNKRKLPAFCYGMIKPQNLVIMIQLGQRGYTSTSWPPGYDQQAQEAWVNKMNAELGVTTPQRMAMEAGSKFGWHSNAADPGTYNPDGSINKEKE